MKSVTIKDLNGLKLIKIKRNRAGNGYEVETLTTLMDIDVVIMDAQGRMVIPIRRGKKEGH
ncbi:MAG: hypothetical protein AAB922_05910 [Patescibacteria group bacterium]